VDCARRQGRELAANQIKIEHSILAEIISRECGLLLTGDGSSSIDCLDVP
jgi:hypothetical protein